MTSARYEERKRLLYGNRLTKEAVLVRKKPGSLKMEQQVIAGILGYVKMIIPLEQVRCQHVAVPAVIESYFDFLRDRKEELPRKDGNGLYALANFVEYLAGEPHLAEDLTAVPNLISLEQLEFIKENWYDHGMDAAEAIRAIAKREVADSVKKVDYTVAIRDILLSEQPMQVIFDMIHVLIDRAKKPLPELDRAEAIKEIWVIAVMICQAVFRPGTIVQADESDVVRGQDKATGKPKISLVMHRKKFKNDKQDVLKDGFCREIQDLFGEIRPFLDEYLDHSRAVILGAPTKILVVNTAANPRFTSDAFGDYLRRLTRRLLTKDLRGKYNARSISCTQFREIVATAIMRAYPEDKEGKKIANTLMNSIPWVYALIAASERSEGIESFLMKVAMPKKGLN